MTLNRKAKKIALLFSMLLLAAALFCVLLIEWPSPVRGEKAVRGSLAILDYGDKPVAVTGEWEFYWIQTLSEDDFASAPPPLYFKSPGVWNSLTVDGKPLPGFGYGTYRLHVSGLPANERIGVYLPVLSVAYELYANGELVARNGVPDPSERGFKPAFLPQIGTFSAPDGEVDLIVHSSNYIYARNGMWHSLYLGTPEQVEQLERMVLYKDLFMIGSFMTLALYYLSIFILRREKQSLLFAFLCIGAIMRTMVNGDRAIARLFEGFPFPLLIKFDYAAIVLFYPVMLYLMTRRFPRDYHKTVSRIFAGLGTAAALLVFALPVSVFTRYVLVAEIFLFATILYTLACLGIAVLRSRKNAYAMFFSILLLLVLTLRDLMYQSAIRDNPLGELGAFGFFTFLLLESFAISRDYAEDYRRAQQLSQQLLESDALKDKIRQTEMAFFQSQIKPHFLFNTLSAIDEYCRIDPAEASRLINSLSRYLRQSFDFENLESTVSIEKELALVRCYVDIETARFDDLSVCYAIEYGDDFMLPPLTIQPLVENAIRHGVRKKAGNGSVTIRINRQDDRIHISIIDDGAGMPREKLDAILSESAKDKRVGLLNIHYRLLRMYGAGLTIQSEQGLGTTVSFSVPVGGKGICA